MRLLYSLLFYLLMPAIVVRMLWRSRLAPAYRQRFAERLGFIAVPADSRPVIWVHAVSVGETLAAAPVVEALLKDYPGHRVALTTMTPTGSERVRELFGARVLHVYAPWDLPGAVRRFLRRLQPALLVIMETELWPNMIHYSARSGCRIVLANARLSARSAAGYAKVAGLTRPMLARLDSVAAQGRGDGERFLALGLSAASLQVTGNIKFDLDISPAMQAEVAALRAALGSEQRPVIVAASTHQGEDELILAAFAGVRTQYPDCLLVLVPRHPERFETVFGLCRDAGWSVARRSSGELPGTDTAILLGDTMGELLLLLGAARLVVMGGSLVEHGGHNVLEAAAWGVPVITGPWMFNFQEIGEQLVAAGAMLQLASPSLLENALLELLADPQQLQIMGQAGKQVLGENRGARARLLAVIAKELMS